MNGNSLEPLDFHQIVQARSGFRYVNLHRLGRGGNATAYLMLAGDGPYEGNFFAVKIFEKITDSERQASFFAEIDFLRECEHPGVLRIFDQGFHRKRFPFVVTEYLPMTLHDVIRSDRTNMVERLSYATQLLSTLIYLDALSPPVIHRDIKPKNIFIKGESCVLGDFGLMKRLDQLPEHDPKSCLKESVGFGMPFFYRTPDLVDYAKGVRLPTTKSDLYQLGLVLAELFTGRNPQRRAKSDDFLSEIKLEELRRIHGDSHTIISDLIRAMLHSDPESRPSLQDLMKGWKGLFLEVAERVNAIEGKVFLA